MNDGPAVAAALTACGVTHVIWVPDSDLGRWDEALSSAPGLRLVRVCREGEAFAVAAGLHLGGKQPVVMVQCTGLFEAGDSLRNFVHDLKLPLFFVVGVRSWQAHQQGKSADTCPVFTEPILQAWRIPYSFLDHAHLAEQLAAAYRQARDERRVGAVLLPE
jgi:sulfopyruvate decarboxylase TPP-binding subunit